MTSALKRAGIASLATCALAAFIACSATPHAETSRVETSRVETIDVRARDASSDSAMPEAAVRVVDSPASIVQNGCAFEGDAQHSFTMSLDGSGPGTFAAVDAGSIRLRFGMSPDDPIEFHAVVARLSFDVQAAASSVSLHTRRPVTYQGVFDTVSTLALRVEPARDAAGSLRIVPRSWSGPKAVVFRNPKPWILGCDHFSVAKVNYVRPKEMVREMGTVFSTDGGPMVPLFAEPDGPPVLSVPSDTIVELLRTTGKWAKIAWDTEDGRFRGYVERRYFDGGVGVMGRGSGSSHTAPGRCNALAPLYVLRRQTRTLHRVGTLLAGALPTLDKSGPGLGAEGRNFVRVLDSPGLVLREGFELYMEEGEASRCLRAL